MKKTSTKWALTELQRSWLLFIGFILLGLSLVPYVYLITSKNCLFDLSEKGGIGDAIGGITAPVIGLLGAFLVYLTLRAQVYANKLVADSNEFKIILELIIEIKRDINDLFSIGDCNEIQAAKNRNKKLRTPYLKELLGSDIKSIPPIFKKKLRYILKDYLFLFRRIKSSQGLKREDNELLINSMLNIYYCYLDNYCKGYASLDIFSKTKADLSKSLIDLAKEVRNMVADNEGNILEDE